MATKCVEFVYLPCPWLHLVFLITVCLWGFNIDPLHELMIVAKSITFMHFSPTPNINAFCGLIEMNKCTPTMINMFTRCNLSHPQ